METTEKIVESYCRYVKGWLTIPNIKCKRQYEIDLLAIDPTNTEGGRYHIETSVSISSTFAKLTAVEYSAKKAKDRVQQAKQRRTIGFFVEKKFGAPEVRERLSEYGFLGEDYKKIIVTMGWKDEVEEVAHREGIILWDFRNLLREIGNMSQTQKTYFMDDTLRTIQLFIKAGT